MKFKIVLNKDKSGSYYNDKIIMTLNPEIVEKIYVHFEDKALKENLCYDTQGEYRKIRDLFKAAYDEWYKKRQSVE